MNQDISILFEVLKSVETPPPMGGCMRWWVDGWGHVKSLKIYGLWRHPHLWVDVWVDGWVNQINLDLIEIIQFWTFLDIFT